MKRKYSRVFSSHGEFKINCDTGEVVNVSVRSRAVEAAANLRNVAKFDVVEYRKWDEANFSLARRTPHDIDILYIGFWTKGGEYSAPIEESRKLAIENAGALVL